MEKMVQEPQFITRKRIQGKRGREKRKGEKKSERWKKDNNKKKEFYIIDHTIRAYPKMLVVLMHEKLFPFNTINQYLFRIFKLGFSHTLYKFIVQAFWTWAHSYFGFESKPVLTIGAVCGKLDLIKRRFWFSAQNGRVRFASTNDRATSG